MNLLPLVLSILFVLVYGSYASLGKYANSKSLRSSFLGHSRAHRKILASYEIARYKRCPGKAKPKATQPKPGPIGTSSDQHKQYAPLVNPECARLNIAPLLSPNGTEENPVLHQLLAHLMKSFYSTTVLKSESEFLFLTTFLKALKSQYVPLEKLQFPKPSFQSLYYRMLKGKKSSYPSLLDYIKIDRENSSPICLYMADELVVRTLFGERAGKKIFAEMHKTGALPITQDDILRLCQEAHTPLFDLQIFSLIKVGKENDDRGNPKQILVETDTNSSVTLRRELYVSLK
jgi:hypothetical protein